MVGPRPELDRLLKQPIEKQPPSARVTTVEAKGELVQVVVQVLVADSRCETGKCRDPCSVLATILESDSSHT
jgi:hypothetical protein